MAQQTLNAPPFRAAFQTGDATDKGDTPADLVNKLQANETELYGKATVSAKYTKNTHAGATTASAGDLSGAQNTVCEYSAIGTAALTLRTAAQMFADAGAIVGQTYELEIMNSGVGTVTVTAPDANTTITGTATIATTVARWYVVTFTSATTMTLQNIGSGSI